MKVALHALAALRQLADHPGQPNDAALQLSLMDGRAWRWLDLHARGGLFPSWSYSRMGPLQAAALVEEHSRRDHAPLLLVFDAFHPSGWVRQAALQALSSVDCRQSLHVALLRASDWVEPVALVARDLLRHVLASADDNTVLLSLDLMEACAATRQRGMGELRQLYQDRFSSDQGFQSLLVFLSSKHPPARPCQRVAARLAMNHPKVDVLRLLRACLACQDDVTTAWGAQQVAHRREEPEYRELLLTQVDHLFAAVRVRVMDALLALRAPGPVESVAARVADPNHDVRTTALRVLKAWNMDALTPCRRFVDDGPRAHHANALLSLCALSKEEEDLARVQRACSSRSARVRCAALQAFTETAGEQAHPILLAALEDPSNRVATQAMALFSSEMVTRHQAALGTLMLTAPRTLTRQLALRLLGRLDRWSALSWFLAALLDGGPDLTPSADIRLDRWLQVSSRAFTHVPRELVEPLRQQLSRARTVLGTRRHQALSRSLADWVR